MRSASLKNNIRFCFRVSLCWDINKIIAKHLQITYLPINQYYQIRPLFLQTVCLVHNIYLSINHTYTTLYYCLQKIYIFSAIHSHASDELRFFNVISCTLTLFKVTSSPLNFPVNEEPLPLLPASFLSGSFPVTASYVPAAFAWQYWWFQVHGYTLWLFHCWFLLPQLHGLRCIRTWWDGRFLPSHDAGLLRRNGWSEPEILL